MTTFRHLSSKKQFGTAVLILICAVLGMALAGSVARSQSPEDLGAVSGPCEGLGAITMIISPVTLVAGNDLTKQTSTADGVCTLTVTLHVSSAAQVGVHLGEEDSWT